MAQNGDKSKSNVVKIDQTELWRMGSNCSRFIASLVFRLPSPAPTPPPGPPPSLKMTYGSVIT